MTNPNNTLYDHITLEEYKEASQICRDYEDKARTGLNLFAILSAGILGLTRVNKDWIVQLLLSITGFIISISMMLSHLRLCAYYAAFKDRVLQLEKELSISLYSYAINNITTKWPSTRKVYTIVYIILSICFITLFLRIVTKK